MTILRVYQFERGISMLRICICDDEKDICQKIHRQLDIYAIHHNQDYDIVECYDANQLLESEPLYDILFLDIRFDNGNIGVQIAEKLRAQDNRAFIIFVTSLSEYYPGCFEVEAFLYLKKPLSDETMIKTMDAVHHRLERESAGFWKIVVPTFSGNVVIDTRRLVAVVSNAMTRCRCFHFLDKPPLETRLPLKEIAIKLDSQRFAYIHQSYIVNLEHVEQIVSAKVFINNGSVVPIGRAYRDSFLLALEQYMGDKI
jgi:DNA-binding LytR/AlgR family response regulator